MVCLEQKPNGITHGGRFCNTTIRMSKQSFLSSRFCNTAVRAIHQQGGVMVAGFATPPYV